MSSSWWQARRIRKLSAEFWNLVGRSETAEALAFYDRRLAPLGIEVSKPTRAAYHFLRWCDGGADDDLQAVTRLAAGMPAQSELGRAAQVAWQLARQRRLARSLGDSQATESPAPASSPADPAAVPLERLAEAILASRAASTARDGGPPPSVAENVLRALPAADDVPDDLRRARTHLFVWASMVLEQYESVCREHARIRESLGVAAEPVLLRAAQGWGHNALLRHDLVRAATALEGLTVLGKDPARREAVLRWGVAALQARASDSAVAWFTQHAQHRVAADPPAWRATVIFGLAVALLQHGRYAEGREVLERWCRLPTPAADTAAEAVQSAPSAAAEMLAQAWHLLVLSLLAGTNDWAAPAREPAVASADRDRELVVQNRALWRSLRDRVRSGMARLADASPAEAWRAHLIEGLLASADGELTLDPAGLERFSAAIEHVDSRGARERLKTIEGALATKVKATEEAVELLRRGDVARLRELKQAVLDSLGDAIPPVVRAAVAMTLWNADAGYDPLAELQRIPVQPANEAVIQQCLHQVRVAQTLRRLTETLLHPGASDGLLPSLEPLVAFDEGVARQGQLAAALVRIQRGDLSAAKESLPEAGAAEDRETIEFLHFHVAWRQGDLRACRQLLAAGIDGNRHLAGADQAAVGVRARCLDQALHAERADDVGKLLVELGGGAAASARFAPAVVRLVARLIEQGRPQHARLLLSCVRRELETDAPASPPDAEPLRWTCQVLETLVAARLGQYTACADLAASLASVAPPAVSGFGESDANRRMLGWCRLTKVEAELAQAAATAERAGAGWRAVRRELEAQRTALEAFPHLQPYLDLMTGLVTFLGTDTLVGEETIARLHAAQQALPLAARAGFIERVVAQLRWRKQIVEAYWNHLGAGDFRTAREIFHQELLPALGERTPHSIKLGLVLADWGCGAAPTAELLQRLDVLQHDAPELAELLDRVRNYLQDGETVRELIRLLRAGEFHQVVELADRTVWTGWSAGAMPVPVAIAKLYALYRVGDTDQAQRFASLITETPNLETWVTDYGGLLLGYICFEKKEAPAAAKAFAAISAAAVLGHDVDRYWAAAHFTHGLQLLRLDNKEQDAFEAFARSLSKRGSAADNARLAPLFIHFGVKSIEERNGIRARRAFEIIAESIRTQPHSPDVVRHRLLADMGSLLSRALMDENVEELGGAAFLDLLSALEPQGVELPPGFPLAAECALRRLAICQELRREVRRDAGARREPKKLYRYLCEQGETLEKLLVAGADDPHDPRFCDPVLLVLQAVTDLFWGGRGKLSAALENVKKAMQLGVQSQRLAMCVSRHQEELQKQANRQAEVLDLFDAYLADGTVPSRVRREFVRRDNLAELYRLHRHYTPEDILLEDGDTGLTAWRARLEHLAACLDSEEHRADARMRAHGAELKKLIEELTKLEDRTATAEKEALSAMAERLRSQEFEPA